ncbi:lipoate--protein ligase family protein [Candidatus Palauibacter sp.]|uniref:lipoate--protein ligase family protein n=1 Tax=Candidatus Palauibacter sp. TaxID=3101350 RepID=UPI003B01F533
MMRGGRPSPGGPPCVLLPYAVADGARNMAFDEAMLEYAAEGRTLVRFYGWEPWCVSLGRNQPAPARLRGRRPRDIRPGVDAVRRPTGGRSVFHGPEITYAFACPDRAWGGPKQVLRTVHRALADGLRSLGVPLDDPPEGAVNTGSPEPFALSPAACFREPAPGELTVGGRKLVGSAQRRRRGGLLQHGSILIEDRQALADLEDAGGLAQSRGVPERGLAIGLREALSATPDPRAIVPRLEEALTREFGPPASPASAAATAAALDRVAAGYVPVHRSAARLWREDPALARHAPGCGPVGTRPGA